MPVFALDWPPAKTAGNPIRKRAPKMMVTGDDSDVRSVMSTDKDTSQKQAELVSRRELLTMDQQHSSSDIFVSISGLIGEIKLFLCNCVYEKSLSCLVRSGQDYPRSRTGQAHGSSMFL